MSTIGGIDLIGGTIAAFGTLLAFDVFCVTLADEVNLIWSCSWSLVQILYLLNRYLPFVDTFLSLFLLFGHVTDEQCLRGFKVVTWFIVIGIIISELILMFRTYALWERNRVILIVLLILVLFAIIPALVIVQFEVNSLAYKSLGRGCSKAKDSSSIIFVAFLMLILCETTIVTLTVIRVWRYHRNSKSAMLVRMYKDGLLYYLYLLAFSIVNIIIALAAPPRYSNWLSTPQRVIHSILGARVVLHIRSHQTKADTVITEMDGSLSFQLQNYSSFPGSFTSDSTELTSFSATASGRTIKFAAVGLE